MNNREITEIIIHCSDSNFGCEKIINKWHVARGWNCIGYHYVITNGRLESGNKYNAAHDGLTQMGRPEQMIGAHCRGHNRHSIGICLIGGVDFGDWMTDSQFSALRSLVLDITSRYGNPELLGHSQINNQKDCPNLNMDLLRERLKYNA